MAASSSRTLAKVSGFDAAVHRVLIARPPRIGVCRWAPDSRSHLPLYLGRYRRIPALAASQAENAGSIPVARSLGRTVARGRCHLFSLAATPKAP